MTPRFRLPSLPPSWRGRLTSAPIRTAGFALALMVALGLIATVTAVEVTSKPRFCGSCHIMAPYYESWQHSSHHNIACVECHIPPGVTAEIRKKFEALSMVARYFTGTYGTNPWTEIEDAACLRCHERRLLAGKELIGDIVFDHTAHLSEMRRGKTLRCTSCHGQLVQGSHIAVTTSTCILCHFKGVEEGEETTRCVICHTTPSKTYELGSVQFRHSDVTRYGMECRWCHEKPQGSEGEVPRERCVTCHNQTIRLEKYGETELLHRKHVSEHKIDCMDCHLHLEHVAPLGEAGSKNAAARLQAATSRIHKGASECRACHEAGHSPQLALYTGTGGRNVESSPSPMFESGVRCEGCHIRLPGQASEVRRASDVSCMACHGPDYRKIYLSWKSSIDQRSGALGRQLAETARAIGTATPRFADARFNHDLVARGRGVHNVEYANALLRQSHADMNAARRGRGLAPLPRPWPEPPYASPCFRCHEGVEQQRGSMFGKPFAHERHVVASKIDCAACHRTHEERDEGEVVRFGASGCVSCHHKPPVADCITCHGDVRKHTVTSFRGEFDHATHLDDAEKTCVECHDLKAPPPGVRTSVCAECHEDE